MFTKCWLCAKLCAGHVKDAALHLFCFVISVGWITKHNECSEGEGEIFQSIFSFLSPKIYSFLVLHGCSQIDIPVNNALTDKGPFLWELHIFQGFSSQSQSAHGHRNAQKRHIALSSPALTPDSVTQSIAKYSSSTFLRISPSYFRN